MAKYNAWSSSGLGGFGFPRKESPAFQRQWKALNASAVAIEDDATQNLVKSAAAGESMAGGTTLSGPGAYATHYIWGLTFVTGNQDFAGGHIKDEDGNILFSCIATHNGPYFVSFDSPIKVTQNSAIVYHRLVHRANSYCTIAYTTTYTQL